MSNVLAIATVTAAVQQILRDAVVPRLPGAEVTTVRPDQLSKNPNECGVNIYLFQVTPNPALRNADLPERTSAGTIIQRGFVALDLHYLLSFYGREERQEPEQLLAIASIAMSQASVLDKDRINRTIALSPGAALAGSNLASQSEKVRFTMCPMALDDVHKLWTIFSPIPYLLSSVYVASVVLLDVDDSRDLAPPVASASLGGPTPAMPAILKDCFPRRLPFLPGSKIKLIGDRLQAGTVAYLEGFPCETTCTSTESFFLLPPQCPAGSLSLQVGDRSGVRRPETVPLIVQPVLVGSIDSRPFNGAPTVLVNVEPVAGPNQSIELVLTPTATGQEGISSSNLLRFFLNPDRILPLHDGDVPATLRTEFAQNGHPLHSNARIVKVKGETRVKDGTGAKAPEYALRLEGNQLSVYFGLFHADPVGTIVFGFKSLAAGRYLVRIRVDQIDSALRAAAPGEPYSEPSMEVS